MFKKITAFFAALIFISVWIPPGPPAAANGAQTALKGKTVILDAGHGRSTTNTYAGYDEQLTMLKLAQKIKPLLEARGATVHMTRPTQNDVSLYIRAALINKWALQAVQESRRVKLRETRSAAIAAYLTKEIKELDGLIGITQSIIDNPKKNAPVYMNTPYSSKRKINSDWKRIFEYENDPAVYNSFLVISLHSNATGKPINTSANGADMFIASSSAYYSGYSSLRLSGLFGDILLNRISPLGIKRNKVNSSNLLMVREHNVPGVLAENGFHTNKSDRSKLMSDAFLNKLATAYADAVTDYFANTGK